MTPASAVVTSIRQQLSKHSACLNLQAVQAGKPKYTPLCPMSGSAPNQRSCCVLCNRTRGKRIMKRGNDLYAYAKHYQQQLCAEEA